MFRRKLIVSPSSVERFEVSFRILAVCTGNICRSPAMERLLVHLFADQQDVEIISGGTYAHDGEDMQPPMKQRVADYGADVDDFIAEQVTVQMIADADLILTATRVHIQDMATDVPEARSRMYTLPEFGRLLGSLDENEVQQAIGSGSSVSEQLQALMPLVEQARISRNPSREDDVVDPYMLPDSVYDESFRQIREPIEALQDVIRLS